MATKLIRRKKLSRRSKDRNNMSLSLDSSIKKNSKRKLLSGQPHRRNYFVKKINREEEYKQSIKEVDA